MRLDVITIFPEYLDPFRHALLGKAIEKNIIQAHMFPLSIVMPKYRESWIVVLADKVCAIQEVTSNLKVRASVSILKSAQFYPVII